MKIFDMKDYIPSPKELENRELAYNIVDDRLSLKVDSGLVIDILEIEEKVENNVISGFKNILINGDMRINQRSFDGDWTGMADWAFGYDRWRNYETGEYIYQEVEEGSYKPSTIYTLSGTNITTQQATSPTSGTWWIGGYSDFIQAIPTNATNIQLEEGVVATAFELRPIGLELSLCQRYFWKGLAAGNGGAYKYGVALTAYIEGNQIMYPVDMRSEPTVAIDTAGTYTNCTYNSLLTGGSVRGFSHRVDVTATGSYRAYDFIYTASAELT